MTVRETIAQLEAEAARERMRDQFAMHIICGLVATQRPGSQNNLSREAMARLAYEIADVMIRVRQEGMRK